MDEVMAPRLSAVTLGVTDMERARGYYGSVFEPMDPPDRPGPCYIRLPGTWLALYPREALARYFALEADGGVGGVTLSVNVDAESDVDVLCARLQAAGGRVSVAPGVPPWGRGRLACVVDPDGHPMELVWNPRGEAG